MSLFSRLVNRYLNGGWIDRFSFNFKNNNGSVCIQLIVSCSLSYKCLLAFVLNFDQNKASIFGMKSHLSDVSACSKAKIPITKK